MDWENSKRVLFAVRLSPFWWGFHPCLKGFLRIIFQESACYHVVVRSFIKASFQIDEYKEVIVFTLNLVLFRHNPLVAVNDSFHLNFNLSSVGAYCKYIDSAGVSNCRQRNEASTT